jgi:hypothetical protein
VTLELIDGIEKILVEAIKTVQDAQVKEKLQSGVDKIRQMKEEEMRERNTEASEVEKNLISNLQF